MALFTWKEIIRVRTGELTRAAQINIWRDADALGLVEKANTDDMLTWTRDGDDLVAAHATRSIEVCVEGVWTLVEGERNVTLPDGDVITLAFPMRAALFGALPKSLANPWIKAAIDENGGLHDALFFASSLVTITPASNGTPPASAS